MISAVGRTPSVRMMLKALLKNVNQPLAIVLAGHNGSGKSTLWYERVADQVKIPLINADRMMLSVLPEFGPERPLPSWAVQIRDHNLVWMGVAQKGVESFVAHAVAGNVPFAMETVFSHWLVLPDGRVQSKVDLIANLKRAGYFVLLLFVGLANVNLSLGRVASRVARGGHAVDPERLLQRFSRTQLAIRSALDVADACILCDNSRSVRNAFTTVHVRAKRQILFDLRLNASAPEAITRWLDVVAPLS